VRGLHRPYHPGEREFHSYGGEGILDLLGRERNVSEGIALMSQENIQQKLDELQKSITGGFTELEAVVKRQDDDLRDMIGVKLAVISGRIIVLEAKLDQIIELGKVILGELEEPPVAASGTLVLGPAEPQ